MFFSTNQEPSKNNSQPNPSSPLFLVLEFPLNRASIIHFMLNGCERYGMVYKALPVSAWSLQLLFDVYQSPTCFWAWSCHHFFYKRGNCHSLRRWCLEAWERRSHSSLYIYFYTRACEIQGHVHSFGSRHPEGKTCSELQMFTCVNSVAKSRDQITWRWDAHNSHPPINVVSALLPAFSVLSFPQQA